MTRQDQLFKWFCYALGFFPVWLLDGYLLPRHPVFGSIPSLLPLTVAAVALLEGAFNGAAFGMAVGLVWVMGGGHGALIFGMTVAGLFCGAAVQSGLKPNFASYLFSSAVLLAALSGVRVLWGVMNRVAQPELLGQVALGEFASSLPWAMLVYPVFRFVYNRVGGEKLA